MLYITGVTGHSGKWLLRRLESEQYNGKIRCVMRDTRESAPEKYEILDNSNLNLEFAIGNLNDEDFLINSLVGVDAIVHIAGISFSEKIINAAIKNNVNWVICVHTTGRYSKYKSASSEYIHIEEDVIVQCKYAKINYTILRPTMIYGSSEDFNMFRLIEYLDKHKLFPLFGNGSNLMQPVHARDLGNAYFDVLMNPDKTKNKDYNLSGRYPSTYLEILKVIRSQLKSKTIFIPLPLSFSIFAATIYNKISSKAIITVEQVMRMQEDKAFSYEEASKDFGYMPLSFEDGIREEIYEYLTGTSVDYSNVRYQ